MGPGVTGLMQLRQADDETDRRDPDILEFPGRQDAELSMDISSDLSAIVFGDPCQYASTAE